MENKCLLGRCFRVYVTKTQESFELFVGKKSTTIRWVFNYGESLAFLTEDWVKEDEQTIKQIMNHVDQGTQYILTEMQRAQNPFLYLFCMRLVSELQGEYNLRSEIINICYQLHKARKDAYILLADCLCIETKSVCARYCELWKGEPLRLTHVCIKPIPAFPLNDGNNRPEIVDTESMCCDKKM